LNLVNQRKSLNCPCPHPTHRTQKTIQRDAVQHAQRQQMDTSSLKVHEAISSPDFVVVFRASPKEVALDAACDQLEKLIQNLAQVGLEIQCRYGGKGVIFVFLRYPDTRLQPLIWSSRYAIFLLAVAGGMESDFVGQWKFSTDYDQPQQSSQTMFCHR
jgi:hypothetical protein